MAFAMSARCSFPPRDDNSIEEPALTH